MALLHYAKKLLPNFKFLRKLIGQPADGKTSSSNHNFLLLDTDLSDNSNLEEKMCDVSMLAYIAILMPNNDTSKYLWLKRYISNALDTHSETVNASPIGYSSRKRTRTLPGKST